jgi:CRP/FNR family cyclic AMP-dependent transcriptional regulator
LSDDDLEWMLKAGRKRSLREGEVLIRQGVPGDEVYILLEGRLAVWLKLRRDQEREIARLEAGEIVGEMSFVDARPPSATVKAVEASTVFGISKAVLSAKLAADQGFAARLYRALAIFLSTMVRERHRRSATAPTRTWRRWRRTSSILPCSTASTWPGAVRPDGQTGDGELSLARGANPNADIGSGTLS